MAVTFSVVFVSASGASVTVPAGAQAVVAFLSHTGSSGTGTLSTIALTGAGTFSIPRNLAGSGTSGVSQALAHALITTTGTQTVTFSFTEGAVEGPGVALVFVTGINTSDWVRGTAVSAPGGSSTSPNATVQSTTADVVIAFNQRYAGYPGTVAGWTSAGQYTNNFHACRVDSANSPGATQTTYTQSGPSYSTLGLISIKQPSGGTTHATTGALTGPGSTTAGSARRFRAHPTSGALAGSGSTVAGSAARTRAHPTSGSLTGSGSTVAGSAARATAAVTHATTGALTGAGSTTAGTAARTRAHPSTGALTGPGSAIAGTAVHQALHTTSGALAGAGATVAGSAARTREHPASGALTGAGSAVAGTAARLALHTTTGALAGPGSAVAGAAARTREHPTSGALSGPGSAVAGSASHQALHTTSGALTGQGAALAGSADHVVPGAAHEATGALVGPGATVAGTAARLALHTTSGALVGPGAQLAGDAARTTVHSTSGTLAGAGAAVAGAADRATPGATHDTSGSLVGPGAEVAGDAALTAASGAGAAAVWSYVLSNGLTAEQTAVETHAMLRDLYRIHGLEITMPLSVGPSSRTAGPIEQAVGEAGGVVTVTRLQ